MQGLDEASPRLKTGKNGQDLHQEHRHSFTVSSTDSQTLVVQSQSTLTRVLQRLSALGAAQQSNENNFWLLPCGRAAVAKTWSAQLAPW